MAVAILGIERPRTLREWNHCRISWVSSLKSYRTALHRSETDRPGEAETTSDRMRKRMTGGGEAGSIRVSPCLPVKRWARALFEKRET